MSNELLIAGALIGGVALGMNETVQRSVRKAGGVTAAAFSAGKDRFSVTEPTSVQVDSVTTLPKAAKA